MKAVDPAVICGSHQPYFFYWVQGLNRTHILSGQRAGPISLHFIASTRPDAGRSTPSRLFPKGSLMKMRQSSHRECSEPRKCLSDCVLTRRKVVGIHDKKSGYIEYLSQGEMHLQEF